MTVARLREGEGQITLLGACCPSRNSHHYGHRNSPGTKSYWSKQMLLLLLLLLLLRRFSRV